jgi:hypothetical protein
MNTRPLYIFDLDGTLALIQHRKHFVEKDNCENCGGTRGGVRGNENLVNGKRMCDYCTVRPEPQPGDGKWKPDWDAFHAACIDDVPNNPVITVFNILATIQSHDMWIFSGRSDAVKAETEAWLNRYVIGYVPRVDRLVMRRAGDYTPDDVLKRSWYDAMSDEDKARLVATFDDRDRVVAMWRSLGVTCFQVAPGDF